MHKDWVGCYGLFVVEDETFIEENGLKGSVLYYDDDGFQEDEECTHGDECEECGWETRIMYTTGDILKKSFELWDGDIEILGIRPIKEDEIGKLKWAGDGEYVDKSTVAHMKRSIKGE